MDHPEFQEQEIQESSQDNQEDTSAEESTQSQPESDKDRNFKMLRESKERAERERDEAVKILRQIEEAKKAQTAPEEDDEPFAIDPEDLVSGKHLTRYEKKMKKLEEKLRSYEHQNTLSQAEQRLKNQYNDFDKVVNKDNVEMLKEMYPEVAQTLIANNDLYSKGVSAYTMIKNLGIHKEELSSEEKEAIARNKTKPRTLTSISPQQGDTPLSRANAFANGLTDDLKIQLRKEMEDARRNH